MALLAHGPRALTSSGDLARFPRSSVPSDWTRPRGHDEPSRGCRLPRDGGTATRLIEVGPLFNFGCCAGPQQLSGKQAARVQPRNRDLRVGMAYLISDLQTFVPIPDSVLSQEPRQRNVSETTPARSYASRTEGSSRPSTTATSTSRARISQPLRPCCSGATSSWARSQSELSLEHFVPRC